ncbi:MAG: HAD hydrolase-like protein [Ignavibacterium sp.]
MKNFDGIIFDIDGTLTSTNQLIFDSFNYISKKYLNKIFTDEEIINLFGPTEDFIIEKLFPDNFSEVKKEYYKYYEENHHKAELYPGIKELLIYLKQKKIFLGIFTGKGRKAATITLKKLSIYDYFDVVITGDDVKEHKPSAEGIIKFLNQFSLSKERVIMIGDAPADVKAAKDAGIKIASVLWDSYAKEEVLKLESNYIFNSVNELKNFLKKILIK